MKRAECIVVFAKCSAVLLAAVEVILDVGTWVELDIATIYGIPLVLAAFTRNRRLLWGLTVALTLATFSVYTLQIPGGTFQLREALFVNRALDAAALLLTAGLLHVWMTSLDVREAQTQLLREQNCKLEAVNDLLVTHEARSSVRTRSWFAAGKRPKKRAIARRVSSARSHMTYAIR